MSRGTLLFALASALGGCGAAPAPSPSVEAPPAGAASRVLPGAGTPGNFLVIVLDDVSANQIEAYGALPGQPHTPTLSTLASAGVAFRNGYAFASCTPARAALLTGRYPSRYGLGNALEGEEERHSLPLSEVTLPEALRQSPYGYTSALVGKWHLNALDAAGPFGPVDQGFEYASGTIENLGTSFSHYPDTDYFRWERITNGTPELVEDYATTVTANDVVSRVEVLPEPWFLMASFNAPHVPYHEPPANLVHHRPTRPCTRDPAGCFVAMVEAADTEIGRMLSEIPPDVLARTTIVLLADNGAAEDSTLPPFDPERSKGTLFDGGVRVPFLVTGPWVRRRGVQSDAFVSITDVFATITELAEVPPLLGWDGQPLATDSVSFAHLLEDPGANALPPRDLYIFSELFHPFGPPPYRNLQRMVRVGDYKLIRNRGVDELYDYAGTELEGEDLMDGGAPARSEALATSVLVDLLDALEPTLTYEGP